MSVFYDNVDDVDALAEEIIERCEERELTHNLYTYKQPSVTDGNKVHGDFISLNLLF